jgi:adenosine kinase
MDIVLTGSVAYDYIMKFPGYFRDHILPDRLESISLSFLVESMVRRRGGIATNIAYTLALLGEKPSVMATVGEDCLGYKAWLSSLGVNTDWMKVVPGEFTASFFANTDRSNAQIASFYPGAMAYASQLSFYDFKAEAGEPDLVVISPNDPGAMNSYVRECSELSLPYLYDPSQQIVRLSVDEIAAGIAGARALFVNDYEFNLIKKATGQSEEELRGKIELVVVTCGENGSVITAGDERYEVPVVATQTVVDPTGVGDAYRGGFLAGLSCGFDWDTCGKMGSLAATYCLEQEGPQGHLFTPVEFTARFRQNFDDEGRLDSILAEK